MAGSMGSWRWSIAAALVLAATTGGAAATAKASLPARPQCDETADQAIGGDWPSLNHDVGNTRHQPAEDTIGTDVAPTLERAWSFDGREVKATGAARSTPIVAHGCVYLSLGQGYLGDRGDIVALDADTGDLVWHRQIDGSVLGLTAANGLIYATPSRGTRGEVSMPVVTEEYASAGAFAMALDARTGRVRWTSQRLDDGNPANGTFVNATPVAFRAGGRDLVFVPLAGGAGDGARVPMYFLDANSGVVVRKAYSLSEVDYAAGYGGTGIWSTAAYDPASQHLFVGTADSDGHTRQHRFNNAILRIDANPARSTFATVVGSYTGTTEHANLDALIGGDVNPACQGAGDAVDVDPPTFFDTSASPTCLELDLDFGGSPNLSADGEDLRVSALQKSGIVHSIDADTMTAAWTRIVGPGGAFMDGSTAAFDGDRLLVGATPNLVYGFGALAGDVQWVASTDTDLFAYQPLTVANDVVYAINDAGFLLAFDARSGVPLLRRAVAVDGSFQQCLGVGAGVAVARHTVFVPCDAGGPADLAGLPASPGGLVAYRPARVSGLG